MEQEIIIKLVNSPWRMCFVLGAFISSCFSGDIEKKRRRRKKGNKWLTGPPCIGILVSVVRRKRSSISGPAVGVTSSLNGHGISVVNIGDGDVLELETVSQRCALVWSCLIENISSLEC